MTDPSHPLFWRDPRMPHVELHLVIETAHLSRVHSWYRPLPAPHTGWSGGVA